MAYIPPNPNGQAASANSAPVVLANDQLTVSNPTSGSQALPVRLTPNVNWRSSFSKVISNGVDTNLFVLKQTGSGQTVNQTAGNLVITAGTTTNSETVIRSLASWQDAFIFRYALNLSQRNTNNNFIIELVDVIGDTLSFTINSATSVTVTIPSNTFTSANVGQSINLGIITGAAGIPGRYAIASVSGNNVTFTVASWPASGSGTLSLFGWNYQQLDYTGTTATTVNYDAQRRGWNSGATAAVINTTASPGHIGQIFQDDSMSIYSDGLVASNTIYQMTQRASRMQNLPANDTQLYLQIRSVNGATAPTATTLTVNFVSLEEYIPTSVVIEGAKQVGAGSAVSVQIQNTPTVATNNFSGAAALADSAANPTTAMTGADVLAYNGTSWDRFRNNVNTTTGDTGAKTASFNGASVTNFNAPGAYVTVLCGTVSGTSPTLVAQLQFSPDGGTTWLALGPASTAVTATGNTITFAVYPSNVSQSSGVTPANLVIGATQQVVINAPLPRLWRVAYTITGTTPSFAITATYVNYVL